MPPQNIAHTFYVVKPEGCVRARLDTVEEILVDASTPI